MKMDAYCASLMVDAMAVQVRVEGMKAENQRRLSAGASLAYDEGAFEAEAQSLHYLAFALRERHEFLTNGGS